MASSDGSYDPDTFPHRVCQINYFFFKVNPHIVDNIFVANDSITDPTLYSSVDADQFLLNLQLNVHAVRNLDFNGLPY